ncbi:MHC class I-like protein MILL2 isoform X1 [Microtus oregoni]|uniref:MHC class I-like protein MILL2 isoform X1 n=1 Tax=Microtus oregoni TaxID=111838 RepID=UPI001BB0D8E3|nr:MHC class I-like protein MILL2 isoform X1 [Microtus oregoni]XP_041510863.1 MHC class I-like protein MILL2 isoform X1 [Microtus oregoni]
MDASSGNPSKSRFTVFLCVFLLLLGDPGRSCPWGPENVHLVITVLSHLGPFWTILAFIQIVPAQETHTLCYQLTVLSPEDAWQPPFPILIYIDDELFLRYNGDSRRAEAWGPRIKGHAGAETWTRETEDFRKKEEQLRRMLAEVMNQQGQKKGLHILQETLGCELQGNRSTGGFWRIGYDGQDFLTFDQKTLTWTMAIPFTQKTKTFWETHAPRADEVKTFLDDICPAQLQGYLASMRNCQMDKGSPEVKVTNRTYPVGRITLTCRAFNLCPPVDTLTWLQDGKPVQQQIFGPRTILPSGDGTYQTWASIWILPGQESEFTCYLRHYDMKVPAAPSKKMRQQSASGGRRQGREGSIGHTITSDTASPASASAVSALPIVLVVVLAKDY